MEPKLYQAAAEGDIEPFKEIAKDDLISMVAPRKNTILHVYIASQTQNREGKSVSAKFVEWILERCPSLLVQVNAKGDAPLHVTAKRGHLAVVEVLIEFARNQPPKELESGVGTVRHMLGMTNEEQNTALHDAVRYDNLDVVKKLIEADTDVPYSTNGNGETPLYMAAARGSGKIVGVILENCPSAAHEGPNGKNALHAAAEFWLDLGVVKLLLEKKKSLRRERDRYGWTPLHHAAYSGNDDVVSMLLLRSDDDASYTACIGNKERKMTALHLAASQGYLDVVFEIIRLCPECSDMVDDRGWNILHFAMVSMEIDQLKELLQECPRLQNLINEKDVMGNTPLHLLAAFKRHSSYDVVPSNRKGDYQAGNKQNISVKHIIRKGYPELLKEIEELSKDLGSGRQYYQGLISIIITSLPVLKTKEERDKARIEQNDKIRASHLVVGALIATVSFAAAFTIPGGYDSSDGVPILRKNRAFQAFIISDTIALLLSLSAVFIHFMTSLDTEREFIGLFDAAILFTMISMGAMVIAFVTGTYAMLAPSLGLAITTCSIALCFFFIGVFILRNMGTSD